MKKGLLSIAGFALLAALLLPALTDAQTTIETIRSTTTKNGEQITITQKSDSIGKMVIVVDGALITVNGKPLNEDDKDVTVTRRKIRDLSAYTAPGEYNYFSSTVNPNQAVLGVTTESTDDGVRVLSISKKSGAEKAGLKKDDVITAIDDKAVKSPDALSRAIRAHKPGDKVTVSYTRDNKKEKLTAELAKIQEVSVTGYGSFNDLGLNFDGQNLNRSLDQLNRVPGIYGRVNFVGTPKLGLTVQDTDDGKGVKVLDVTDESNADKAGIKEDDVILEVDGKAVAGADDIAQIMKDSKTLVSVKFKYLRDGKTSSVDVKIPKKLKTANL